MAAHRADHDAGSASKLAFRSSLVRSYGLETEALRLIEQGQFAASVLVSQTLLELRTEAELSDFFRNCQEPSLGEPVLRLLPGFNPANSRVRKFIEGISGTRLFEEHHDIFDALHRHSKLRNAVAHTGIPVAEGQARESISTVSEVAKILHEVLYRALGREDELEEEERQEQES